MYRLSLSLNTSVTISLLCCLPVCLEPFYDSVMDDYDDEDDTSPSSGLKKLGVSLGLKLRPWEGCGVRSAKSEVSLIDFTDDSFSSTTPSPLTETQQPDEDTLKVYLERCSRNIKILFVSLTSACMKILLFLQKIPGHFICARCATLMQIHILKMTAVETDKASLLIN